MSEFFDSIFYGNTVSSWLIALGIIIGSAIVAKIAYLIFSKFVKKLTKLNSVSTQS